MLSTVCLLKRPEDNYTNIGIDKIKKVPPYRSQVEPCKQTEFILNDYMPVCNSLFVIYFSSGVKFGPAAGPIGVVNRSDKCCGSKKATQLSCISTGFQTI
jgi:hypothetical protein